MKDAKPETIHAFNDAQVGDDQQICEMLRRMIDRNLTGQRARYGMLIQYGSWMAIPLSDAAS